MTALGERRGTCLRRKELPELHISSREPIPEDFLIHRYVGLQSFVLEVIEAAEYVALKDPSRGVAIWLPGWSMSRHCTPSGSRRPFQVEHVGSCPGNYGPALAFSAILYPLARPTSCDSFTWPIHPGDQRAYRAPRQRHDEEGAVFPPG